MRSNFQCSLWLGLGLAFLTAQAPRALADDFSTYQVNNSATFLLPQGDPDPENRSTAVFDNLADGRILVITTALPDPFGSEGVPEVYVETAVGSRTWDYLGDLSLPSGSTWSTFGAAFMSISPDGSRVAVGDNGSTQHVGVFATADLLSSGAASMSIDWFEAAHSTGAWFDNKRLALNYGNFETSNVSLLDTDSSVGSPVNPDVITGIQGGSGGVAFDDDGNLYTGNGFANAAPGGSATGDIRKFLKEGAGGWQEALDNATPLNFETAGSFFYHSLSASSLEFDSEGNLFIGGSDYFGSSGDGDYLALRQNPLNGSGERTFDPDTLATSFYNLVYNEVTGELYANEPFMLIEPIDNTTVYVISPVPEPSSLVLLVIGAAGIVAWRRKRRP